MSTPFTNPYSAPTGQLWQTLLNELTLAEAEREQAAEIWPLNGIPLWNAAAMYYDSSWSGDKVRYGIGIWASLQDGNVGNLPDEVGSLWWTLLPQVDVQNVSYWSSKQQNLEGSYIFDFVDHINGPLSTDLKSFRNFGVDTWRAVAGLNELGFRRSTDGVSFSYGTMVKGDIIGPWIFEDLQKGFSALRWCDDSVSESGWGAETNSGNTTGYFFGCDGGRNNGGIDFLAKPWNSGPGLYRIHCNAFSRYYSGAGTAYFWLNEKTVGGIAVGNLSGASVRPRAVDLYLKYTWTGSAPVTDPDSLGFTRNIMTLKNSWGESLSSNFNDGTAWNGTKTIAPHDSLGLICPVPKSFSARLYPEWLTKWNFTNQNA